MNVVERFTFKPHSMDMDLPNPSPRLPSEIQYWADVIMWNAFGSVRIVSVFLMIVGLLSLQHFVVFLLSTSFVFL